MSKKNKIKIFIAILSMITFIILLVLFCLDIKDYIEYKNNLDSIINVDSNILNPMKRELAASFFTLIIPLFICCLSVFSIDQIYDTKKTPKSQKKYIIQRSSSNYNLAEENISFYESYIKQIQEQRNDENSIDIDKQLTFLYGQLEFWKSNKND